MHRLATARIYYKVLALILTIALLLSAPFPLSAAANQLPALDEPPDPSACALFPIALSAESLADAHVGDDLADIFNGAQPGNFGWLSWAGSPSTPALVKSLTPPSDSSTYINPDDPTDTAISPGDWIQGRPGVSNSKKVREALDALTALDIAVPVWDSARGQGSNSAYRVVAFARVRLLDYQLPKENRISARFLGYTCEGAVIELDKSAGSTTLISTLGLDLGVNQNEAIPGDELTYTITVTNTGTLLTLSGQFAAENFSDVVATVAYYDDLIEYQLAANDEWVPLAGTAASLPGYLPVSPAPMTSGITLEAEGIPASGVVYPTEGDGIIGTQLDPGGIAVWDYQATISLSPEQASLLLDTELVLDVRNIIHLEVTPRLPERGQPFVGRISFVNQLQAQSGDLTDVIIILTLPDGQEVISDQSTTPGLSVLVPGASASVEETYQIPAIDLKGVDETDEAYLARLAGADVTLLAATSDATADSNGTLVSAPQDTASTTQHVPIVTLSKSGPETVEPGTTVVYDLTLNNIGSAEAREPALEDLLPGDDLGTIYDVPAALDPGASAVARASHALPLAQPPGDLTDTASVVWKDANDNAYGPIFATFTTEVISLVPEGLLTLAPAYAGPNVIGTLQSLVATLKDTNDVPLPGVTIQFTVTGPNAMTDEVITEPDGTATFTYTGTTNGNDSVQAVADLAGTPVESNVATVHWITPLQPVTTSTIWGRFFWADNSGRFNTPTTQDPAFSKAFPSINFNPPAGTVPGNTSGVGVRTRPFTNVTMDLNGNFAGTIVAQGNGLQAGVGPLFNFSAVLTGEFTIETEGNVIYDFYSDDGFIFGIGNGAERVGGSNTNPPPSGLTPFESYPVMGAYNIPTSPKRNSIEVYFPEPGVYPFEIDYTECCGGELALTLAVRETGFGVTPLGALIISPNSRQTHLTGQQQIFNVTAQDASGLPLTNMTVMLRVSGANTQELTAVTDASGVATFAYTGNNVGGDSVQAIAWAQGSVSAYSAEVQVNWQRGAPPPTDPGTPLAVPGWIGSPANQSALTGQVPIGLKSGVTLVEGTLDYWPVDDSSAGVVLATGLSGTGTLATLDTTLLPNGSYVIRLQGTDPSGNQVNSGILVTVEGEYKPGRVRFTIRDLMVPVTGLPITIGRTYDSLERGRSGDFGHGWELAIGNPRVEVNPAHDVTITMPDGRRVTFYFTPYAPSPWFGFLLVPDYTPEAGVYGDLTGNGCGLLTVSSGKYFCFPGGFYSATEFTYTDPYGRVYVMESSGVLRSITDLSGNTLAFSDSGIVSSAGGLNVPFARDAEGRITEITDPEGNVYTYSYDVAGDLAEVHLPGVSNPILYSYDTDHNFQSAVDPRGNTIILSTYDSDGRLVSETDALGNTYSYAYDLTGRTTTLTNPDGGVVATTRDVHGSILSHTDPLGHTTTYAYDSNYNLTSRTDALGNVTSYTYDGNGNQTSVTDPLGNTNTTSYNQYGGPTTKVDPLGNAETITYDTAFRPTAISDSLGSIAALTWSSRGDLLSRANGNGEVTSFTYDVFGNQSSETDPLGQTTTYTYDLLGRRVSETDALGNITRFSYDALGRLLSVTDALGQVTRYEYDSNGNTTAIVDAKGARSTFTYDAANNQSTITYPDGTTETFTYDWRGNVLTHTNQAGNSTSYAYDLAGQLLRITYADGSSESFGYDAVGRRVSHTDERGNTTTYALDAADRLVSITDPLGYSTGYTYDATGRRVSALDANGHATSFSLDSRGQQIGTTYPDGTMDLASYDAAGRLLSRTDQAGLVTSYSYDGAGRLVSVTDPLGQVTVYTYDSAGNLIAISDANGHVTSFAYDALGYQVSKNWPDGSFEAFTYDAVGNQTNHRLADGNTNFFTYDSMDRLVQSDHFDGQQFSHTYTPTGMRKSVIDSRGTTIYTYNSLDRVVQITTPSSQSISYSYDAAGNRASMTTPSGTIAYTYDANGRLASVTDPMGETVTYDYDPVGNRIQKVLPNGVESSYAYDNLNRLTELIHSNGGATLASYAYSLGPAGNRLSVTEMDGSSIEWIYDDAYRLIGESRLDSGGTTVSETAFSYDAVGNRLSMVVDGMTTSYSYNALDQMLSAGTTAFTYDARGNLVQVVDGLDTTTYAFDGLDRLAGAALPDGTLVSYLYDADGRRVQQDIDATITNFLWDELSPYGDVVLETDGGGGILASYVLGGTELLSQTRGGATSYYLHDGQGSVRALSDPAGGFTDTYSYTAFGELFSSTGTTLNTYTFTGQQFDTLTGEYYLRARYYNPIDGRFLSRDLAPFQVNNPTELNRYIYALNNPANLRDPTGLQALSEYSLKNQESAEEAVAAQQTGLITETTLAAARAKLRATYLQSLFTAIEHRYRTVAVGWIVTKLGERIQIVAVSGQNWSARILDALAADELMIVGLKGHAEQLIMEYANQIGAVAVAIGAGRNPCVEICQTLAQILADKGVLVLLQ
jgi:RHS repeat-associated protein